MRKIAIAAGGLAALLLGAVGVTSAFAATSPTPSTTNTAPPAVQSGPQSTVPEPGEVPGAESSETAPETATETAPGVEANSAEAAADASLPGGGHADPDGQNVDHQFEGVE